MLASFLAGNQLYQEAACHLRLGGGGREEGMHPLLEPPGSAPACSPVNPIHLNEQGGI